MKPCASPLALLLIVALTMPALPARAAVPKECQATAKLNAEIKGEYLKVCEQAVKDIAAAQIKEQQAEQMKANTSIGIAGSQADSAQAAANLSGAAAATQERRANLANEAAGQYLQAENALKSSFKKLMEEDVPRFQGLPAANRSRLVSLTQSASEEITELRSRARSGATSATRSAGLYRSGQSQLAGQQIQTQKVADGLKQGSDGGGVGSGTWVALGGAALIAAGTVGGIAYFGNKGLNKLDKMADQKIEKAGDEAKEVIKEAEDTAKRIIEFASAKANTVLANAEQTVTNIIEKAKKEGEAIIDKIGEEIQAQFENLSTTGLEKLRTEMGNVFEEAIAKAKNLGNTQLVETLTKARDRTMERIQKEIDRRNAATSTGTTTSTATSTATSTSTSSQSSTATQTTTQTATSSATVTASNPVTTTSTSTSTSIRQ